MPRGDRRVVGGIGDLRDKAAVLAERSGDAAGACRTAALPARAAGWPCSRRRRRSTSVDLAAFGPVIPRGAVRAIAAFTAPSIGRRDRKAAQSASQQQRHQGGMPGRVAAEADLDVPIACRSAATSPISCMTAGLVDIAEVGHAVMSRAAAVTYWVRSFDADREELGGGRILGTMATAGTSTMMPSGGRAAGYALRARAAAAPRRGCAARRAISPGTVTIGSMTLSVPRSAGASERAELRRGKRRAAPATGGCRAARGTDSTRVDGQARHRLVAAGVERADGDGPPAGPVERPWRRRDTASPRRAAPSPVNRNSVRTRPTPSQIATSSLVELLRARRR